MINDLLKPLAETLYKGFVVLYDDKNDLVGQPKIYHSENHIGGYSNQYTGRVELSDIKDWAVDLLQGSGSSSSGPVVRDPTLREILTHYCMDMESQELFESFLISNYADIAVFAYDSSVIHESQRLHIK